MLINPLTYKEKNLRKKVANFSRPAGSHSLSTFIPRLSLTPTTHLNVFILVGQIFKESGERLLGFKDEVVGRITLVDVENDVNDDLPQVAGSAAQKGGLEHKKGILVPHSVT